MILNRAKEQSVQESTGIGITLATNQVQILHARRFMSAHPPATVSDLVGASKKQITFEAKPWRSEYDLAD